MVSLITCDQSLLYQELILTFIKQEEKYNTWIYPWKFFFFFEFLAWQMLVESYLGLLNILIRVRGDDSQTGMALIDSFKDFF